jgi:hypothetical protein
LAEQNADDQFERGALDAEHNYQRTQSDDGGFAVSTSYGRLRHGSRSNGPPDIFA